MEKIILILAIGTLFLGGFEGMVLAEEDRGAGKIALKPITVTASRTERRITEVSSSVSIITEEQIEDSNAKNVPDLLKNLEGIYTYDASGVGTAGRINMRGFWGGMSTHQLVLVDGVPQNESRDKLVDWGLISLDNIERIEVVRGPASALYGDNAVSGVINIITKKPSDVPETRIFGSYGDFETQNYRASTSGYFKKIGYCLGASRKSTDGFRKHSDYENLHLNGKLDFMIDETQSAKLSLDYYSRERGVHPWALTETQVEQDRRQARPGSENDESEADKFNLGLTYRNDAIGKISNIDGTFYYRYKDNEAFYTSGSTGSSTKEQLCEENTYGLTPRLNVNVDFFGMEHSFTTGIDLERNDVDYEEYNAPYQARGSMRKDYSVEKDKIGPYIQGEVKLFEPLMFMAGVRYDYVEFDFTDYKDESNSKGSHMSKISPRCGIVYTYREDSSFYANYSQAFRSPTIGQLFTYGSYSNPDLSPEEATNYEIGVHHQIADNVKVNTALYWMELDDEILYDYSASQYKNIGETSHKGIETGLDIEVMDGLVGFANYTYTRAKEESGSSSGNYLTNVPIHKGGLGVSYDTDIGLKANLRINRVGSSYLDSANENKLAPYTTMDAKISYKYKIWSAFMAVDNLLDKEYNSYGFKSGSTKKFSPAPKRTFTFGVEVKF